MNDISVINLFLEAGVVVKTVMLILLVASLLTWIVIVERHNFYKKIKDIKELGPKNVTNALFVGSTTELQKMIKKNKDKK